MVFTSLPCIPLFNRLLLHTFSLQLQPFPISLINHSFHSPYQSLLDFFCHQITPFMPYKFSSITFRLFSLYLLSLRSVYLLLIRPTGLSMSWVVSSLSLQFISSPTILLLTAPCFSSFPQTWFSHTLARHSLPPFTFPPIISSFVFLKSPLLPYL